MMEFGITPVENGNDAIPIRNSNRRGGRHIHRFADLFGDVPRYQQIRITVPACLGQAGG
jgi:hypothetical protein